MLTAAEMVDRFRRRELSPVEVLPPREDPHGAWVAWNPDAEAQARAAEAAWRRGEPDGPLCGVPVAVKDLFDTADLATECGSAVLAGRVPAADAAAVTRARAAGAVIAGKTSTVEFAWGLMMRTARNPLDPSRTPGGSSGGSAIAVATGAVPLALATDTGGSTRVPAAFCGVVGFKPSHAAVPTAGCWPLAPVLDHVGVLARTVADARLLFGAVAEPAELRSLPGRADVGSLRRVGVPRELGVPLQPGVAAEFERAQAALEADGVEIVRVELPGPDEVMAAYGPRLLVTALAIHRREGLWPTHRERYTDSVRTRLELAEAVKRESVVEATQLEARVRAAYDAALRQADVLLTPVSAVPAPRLDDPTDLRGTASPLVCPQNLLGLPACALPTGVQLTGRGGADELVLDAAAHLTILLNC